MANDTTDIFLVAQQVQAVCVSNVQLKDRIVTLLKELDTRNEDNRRLQKMVTDLQKEVAALSNTKVKNG